MKRIYYFNII